MPIRCDQFLRHSVRFYYNLAIGNIKEEGGYGKNSPVPFCSEYDADIQGNRISFDCAPVILWLTLTIVTVGENRRSRLFVPDMRPVQMPHSGLRIS